MNGSAEDTIMTEPAIESQPDIAATSSSITTTTTTTTLRTDSTKPTEHLAKKPPGSGPIPITMDVYHQLQQKRLLERQQQEQSKQQSTPEQEQANRRKSSPSAPQNEKPGMQPSLDTLEQIVNIVQQTAPVVPLPPQPQQVQLPGPDLANIIFGSTSSTGQTTGNESGLPPGTLKSGSRGEGQTGNGSSSSNINHHRKSAGGASSNLQSQARTTSPSTPAPISGSSSGAHKSQSSKGQKSIHAIELIRIAGEILQFPPTTTGTALVYYHKYRAYLHQANKRGERDNEAVKADEYLFATACLHLACKCTEVSRKVRDLVNVTYRVMNPNQPVLSLSTKPDDGGMSVTDPSSSTGSTGQPSQQHTFPTAPPPTVTTYWHIRDSLLTTELMLLRILQFDLDVSLPFGDVLRIYKGMGMVFSPTDEEAAQLYPNASNFDVFLPATLNTTSSSSPSPNKHGTPSSSSSSSSAPPLSSVAPHTGIHPTLSALAQISTTFCIDALCSSNIALNSSSRALAMGAVYLAIRSAGLELPLPFDEWCHAWGRPNIIAGFGIQTSGGYGISGPGMGVGMGSGVIGVSGVNGILGPNSGTNNLFVSSPRPVSDSTSSFMEGLELTNGLAGTNGISSKDSVYSQTQSPLIGNPQPSLSMPASLDSSQDHSSVGGSSNTPMQQQPMTIVDEVRKVVQELGSFYTH